MADIELLRFRAGEGLERDIANAVLDALSEDAPVTSAIVDALIKNALERYSDKISAMLRRGGFDVENDEPLTVDDVKDIAQRALGFELDSLDPDAIMQAVDGMAAERLSSALGVEIDSVLNLDEAMENAALQVFAEGAGGLVSASLYARAKRAATWARAGYDKAGIKQVQNVLSQRRYRRSNVYGWD